MRRRGNTCWPAQGNEIWRTTDIEESGKCHESDGLISGASSIESPRWRFGKVWVA